MKKRGGLKKAQVNIITLVLFILIILILILILWNIIVPLIRESSEEAEIGVKMLSLQGELAYYSVDNFASIDVKIHRGSGGGEISGVKIVFKKSNGVWIYEDRNDYPEALETVTYHIGINDVSPSGIGDFNNLEEVSFHFIYGKGRSERVSREMDKEGEADDPPSADCIDSDGDGYGSVVSSKCLNSGVDCDDTKDYVNPGKQEICNDELDNNCDTNTDEPGCIVGDCYHPGQNPFLICTCDDLNKTRDDLNADYKVKADIDCNVPPYNSGAGFDPIGNSPNQFKGSFYGEGHIIKNLFIDRPFEYFVGLFGSIYIPGNINNLGLEDVDITGYGYVGGLAGYNRGAIKNSYVTGSIEGYGQSYYVGGLVGRKDSIGAIEYSYSIANVNGYSYVGGLVGYSSGTITDSYYSADVTIVCDNNCNVIGRQSSDDLKDSGWSGYDNWDFSNDWKWEALISEYPVLVQL